MSLWKVIQKQIYDLFSHKQALFFILVLFTFVIVTAFQFGETWLQWSTVRYSSIFNRFHDNIAGRNLQEKLCQSVPIDVVYTWVNGSDPLFQETLLKEKSEFKIEDINHKRGPCHFRSCVPSHFISTKGGLPLTPDTKVEVLAHASEFSLVPLNGRTWTLLQYPSVEEAKSADGILKLAGRNFSLHQAFWTTDPDAKNSVNLRQFVILLGVPASASKETVIKSLPSNLRVVGVWIYLDQGLAVLQLPHAVGQDTLRNSYPNITVGSKDAFLSPAHLVLELTSIEHNEDFSDSRFHDKEELRYSLRSVEKYAPWVRHVYVVTNGQIPYWLNLDHPRLSVVTHQQLFVNQSHLPTFSSPAIESHLHRIPGLSKRFLYLNDDVMFGKDVWPEDFYTETEGQKVYLSWPVPECQEGCPTSWISDGSCDKACNVSECMWDGGDCKDGVEPQMEFLREEQEDFDHWSATLDDPDSCAPNCADGWLADKFCDLNCNYFACGFDAGDCGTANFYRLHEFKMSTFKNFTYVMPDNVLGAFWNVSDILDDGQPVDGEFEDHVAIRVWSLNTNLKLVILVLRPKVAESVIKGYIKGIRNGEKYEIQLKVRINTWGARPEVNGTHQATKSSTTEKARFKSFTGLPIGAQLGPQDLTNSLRKILGFDDSEGNFDRRLGRKLLDTFADSLLHVNRLYNNAFGFEARKVPAHSAHLIDKDVMAELQKRFPREWDVTSSHKFRSPMDMQFAFSYYYFLMHEKEDVHIGEIFDMFDTDKSGTWSDREMRTVLARLHAILKFSFVTEFEEELTNCSKTHTSVLVDVPTPPYEHYLDSKVPTITKQLVSLCESVNSRLIRKFGRRNKYKTKVMGEEEVAFKMLTSNLSQVVDSLDNLRRRPRKFVCINDNLDPTKEKENGYVRAVLQDFYESILPEPSKFELPLMYRNRFLTVDELQVWVQYRHFVMCAIVVCVITLIVLTCVALNGEVVHVGRLMHHRLCQKIQNARICQV
ncbi:N-acetylglucosamine-1-phosphotransferase subunits alpha/beta [Neocloeon triangulifer]|uniref:N-acetylglucosamine-1-phosphotransferase subunits alpha/beta n=1 Tax=Neocloeon triangulifer TaxID=2078957 RepID=UPI00286EC632|nr:N-acetylglucosamine-1-phosphotransferase subunits alpha/beta [Neocloeon triangulifer]